MLGFPSVGFGLASLFPWISFLFSLEKFPRRIFGGWRIGPRLTGADSSSAVVSSAFGDRATGRLGALCEGQKKAPKRVKRLLADRRDAFWASAPAASPPALAPRG